MKRAWVVLALCLTTPFAALAEEPMTYDEVVASARAGVDFVDNDYVATRISENADLKLFDVRTEAEFELGYIPGATWLPRGTAEFRIANSVRDADAEIIIYCRSGSRAALVKKSLDAQGYRNVSVHEGFKAWIDEGRAFETELGILQKVPAE